MNTTEIRKLIESFYNGETSQEEEWLLRDYFNSDNVVEELTKEKNIFLLYYTAKDRIEVPVSLELKIENLIDNMAEQDGKKKKLTIKRIALWSSVAASVAVLFSIGIYLNNLSLEADNSAFVKGQENAIQVTDTEYIQAEKAMRLFSTNFNKGMQQLNEVNDSLEKTNEILNKTFRHNN